MRRLLPLLAAFGLLVCLSRGEAQRKKAEKKDAPRVAVVLPLGVPAGAATRVTVRGSKLDAATEIRFQNVKAAVKILGKGKAPVPDKLQADRVGDTQVEAEVTLPKDAPPGPAAFTVVTPAGETPPHTLLVEAGVEPEKEPNNGFRQAQPVRVPQTIAGAVREPRDVEVFRLDGKAGQRLVVEVQAARHGSALDAVLVLYDAGTRQVAAGDDAGGTADARLEVTLPRDSAYYLTLQDAHDLGGPLHVYRLVLRAKP